MKNRRSDGRWRRGSSAVEFAMTLPIFFLLVIGIIEFGWYFFVQHTMQYATREGMRLALVGRTINGPGGQPLTPIDSIVQTIKHNAAPAVDPAMVNVSVYIVNPANNFADPSGWQGTQNAGQRGDYMRVRSLYTHQLFTPLIGAFFTGGGITIRAEGTYRNE